MESVVVFVKSARPRSLSNPMEPDTETETERENNNNNAASSVWGKYNGYPFPVMDTTVTLSELSGIPSESAIGMNGMSAGMGAGGGAGERRMVYLETLMLPGVKPPALRGSGECFFFRFWVCLCVGWVWDWQHGGGCGG